MAAELPQSVCKDLFKSTTKENFSELQDLQCVMPPQPWTTIPLLTLLTLLTHRQAVCILLPRRSRLLQQTKFVEKFQIKEEAN